MPKWNHTLHLADFWHDDSLSLSEKTAHFVTRVKSSRWFEDLDEAYILQEILDFMVDSAQDGETDEWNAHLSDLYDVFNRERIWVATV